MSQRHLNMPPLSGPLDKQVAQLYAMMTKTRNQMRKDVNDNALTKARLWGDSIGGRVGVQASRTSGTGYVQICSPADAGSIRHIRRITIQQTAGPGNIVALFLHAGVFYFRFLTTPVIAPGGSHVFNHWLWLPVTYDIVVNTGAADTHDVTVHYGVENLGDGDLLYDGKITNVLATPASWTTIVPEPDEGVERRVRTLTFQNFNAAAPTTTVALVDTSGPTRYEIDRIAVAMLASEVWDEPFYLPHGWELQAQQSVNPTTFYVTAHWCDVVTGA